MYLLMILQGAELLGTLVVQGLELALKIKAIFKLPSDEFTVNIKHLADEAILTDEATMALVQAWREKNGLPPL
jgi:hypothetical protein